jgi:exocyst complex component 4
MSSAAASVFARHQRLRMDSLERNGTETQSYTLLDLFWTVYSKFRAVLEGHRVVSEVVSRIAMVSQFVRQMT